MCLSPYRTLHTNPTTAHDDATHTMPDKPLILWFGARAHEAAARCAAAGTRVEAVSTDRLRDVSAEVLNARCAGASEDIVICADAALQWGAECFQDLVELLDGKNPFLSISKITCAIYLVQHRVNGWKDATTAPAIWDWYPDKLAILVWPPEDFAAVAFRRDSFAGTQQPFRSVAHPVWERLVRAISSREFVLEMERQDRSLFPVSELPALLPKPPRKKLNWLLKCIESLTARDFVSDRRREECKVSQTDVVALRAGLLQIHDYLDASHGQSQSVEGEGTHHNGDHWHAIMHRREGDYSNSKYWYRHVGDSPIFAPLATDAAKILAECNSPAAQEWQSRLIGPRGWDPFVFVDMAQEASRKKDPLLDRVCRQIQWLEMLLLIGQTYRDAFVYTGPEDPGVADS